MTINEAIRHCEEVAEKYEKCAEYRPRMDFYDEITSTEECYQCASDYRQLAAWLKELQEFRYIASIGG